MKIPKWKKYENLYYVSYYASITEGYQPGKVNEIQIVKHDNYYDLRYTDGYKIYQLFGVYPNNLGVAKDLLYMLLNL